MTVRNLMHVLPSFFLQICFCSGMQESTKHDQLTSIQKEQKLKQQTTTPHP
jgi:hypothetical protein